MARRRKQHHDTEAQATLQFRVSGINLQDLQDFCRERGKENKNANCTSVLGLLESFRDALRAEIFQKLNPNFSNCFKQ